MKAYAGIRRGLVGLFGILLAVCAGCASYPISKGLREQAKPLTVAQVASSPGAYSGTIVIWGGRVINTVNDTSGGRIYVLGLPLTRHEVPVWNGITTGRFVVRGQGFIDPEVFKAGRLITVAGEVTGVEKQPLQGIQYAYPVVASRELRLWVTPAEYYYYPGWYWGWYGPGWGWGWYGPG